MTSGAPLAAAHAPARDAAVVQRRGVPRGLAVALTLGVFIGMADATLVAVALSPLAHHFGVSLAAAQAVLSVYLVTATTTLPTLGRLGDRLGRRRVYVAGFAVFAAGSLLGAVAPDFAVLLVARGVQAAGGGMLTAGALTLMTQHTPAASRSHSVALLVLAQAGAGFVGPPLGGALVALGGWQAVFWVGIPVGAAGAATALRFVPRDSGHGAVRVDVPGAAALAAVLLGVSGALASLGAGSLAGLRPLAWLGIAAGGAVALAAWEPRAARPIVDPRLLLDRRFGLAALATLLSTGALMTCLAMLPYWLEDAHGAPAAAAGAALLPVAVGIGLTSRRAGRLADAGRVRALLGGGMVTCAAGLAVAAAAVAAGRVWAVPAGLLLVGLGNGAFSAPNTGAAISVAPQGVLGSAAGLLSTARNAGVAAGLGAAGGVYTAASAGSRDAATSGVLAVAAIACLLAGAIGWWGHGRAA